MKIVGIIPSRMASSRFPGKPLALLAGHPMIEHVYRRAARCPYLSEVYLATCDREIYDATLRFGGKPLMTAGSHVRGTDRVAEAAQQVQADVVINIQGDEPLIHPDALSQLCETVLAAPAVPCVNLANVIQEESDFLNPNQVKLVCDRQGNVLYMSRQPIPTSQPWGRVPALRQLGVVAFRKGFLQLFAQLEPAALEQAESIDMLRAVEHGYQVKVVVSSYESFGVDRPEDLAAAERRLLADEVAAGLFPAASA